MAEPTLAYTKNKVEMNLSRSALSETTLKESPNLPKVIPGIKSRLGEVRKTIGKIDNRRRTESNVYILYIC